jgi:ATP-dependent DNA ligase
LQRRDHVEVALRPSIFVPPGEPLLCNRPRKGDAWLHEVKFDGHRMQIHKADGNAKTRALERDQNRATFFLEPRQRSQLFK